MNERYYRVGPRFWTDAETWSDDAKLLALYILTCSHRRLEGIFRLPRAYILADLGWSAERFAKPFAELLSKGFLDYDEERSIVLILRALKWQAPENPNQVKSAVKAIAELPPTPLLSQFRELAKRFSERLTEGLDERFPEGFAKPLSLSLPPSIALEEVSNDTSVELALDVSADVREVFNYWREKTGRPKAKLTADKRKAANARRKEGFSVEELKAGVDGSQTPRAVDDKTGHRYDDFLNIFRNAGNLETNIERAAAATPDTKDFLARLNAGRS